jgi:hypothetical protein
MAWRSVTLRRKPSRSSNGWACRIEQVKETEQLVLVPECRGRREEEDALDAARECCQSGRLGCGLYVSRGGDDVVSLVDDQKVDLPIPSQMRDLAVCVDLDRVSEV